MTIERLREAVQTKPFRPFSLCLADGRAIRVRGPECVLLPPGAQRTFIVAETGEDYRIIDLLMVTSIDYIPARPRRARPDGTRRRP